MPIFPGLKRFDRGYLQIQQLNGKDVRQIIRVIIPLLHGLFPPEWNFPSGKFVRASRLVFEVYYLVTAPSMSTELLEDHVFPKLQELNSIRSLFARVSHMLVYSTHKLIIILF